LLLETSRQEYGRLNKRVLRKTIGAVGLAFAMLSSAKANFSPSILEAITNVAPTYTNGQLVPFWWTDLLGFPYVHPIADGLLGSAFGSYGQQIAGNDGTNLNAVTVDSSGSLQTKGSSVIYTGSGSSNNAYLTTAVLSNTAIDCSNYTSFVLQISGTFNATVSPYGSNDGVTFFALPVIQVNSSFSGDSGNITATGLYQPSRQIPRYLRLQITTYTSGTVGCSIRLTSGPTSSSLVTVTAGVNAYLTTNTSGSSTAGVPITKILTTASTNLMAFTSNAYHFVYGYALTNPSASWAYLHFYNTGSATVGTTVPYYTIGIPPGQTITHDDHLGQVFPVGISWAITTGYADTDATATTAGQVVGEIDAK
jgi:hypothetical protein